MRKIKILAVSYSFPPLAFPRSIQVARLLTNLGYHLVAVCGKNAGVEEDETIAPNISEYFDFVLRIPDQRSILKRILGAIAYRYKLPFFNLPDPQRQWVKSAYQHFIKWQRGTKYQPDLIMTFGQPMSDHCFGLAYKKLHNIPWIAHFSDPWTDNQFRHDNYLTAYLNRNMEKSVISQADALIFTSPETIDLVMRKYPPDWKKKVFYIPHCYDKTLYDRDLVPDKMVYTIRYVGNFYARRSPLPLYKAMELVFSKNPLLFNNILFELVGSVDKFNKDLLNSFPLAKKFIRLKKPVSYLDSLKLMKTAHCLLLIDAPAEFSVFFPSKLVDYIAADRFIFAITAPGTAERIVRGIGGLVADPLDENMVAKKLAVILKEKPEKLLRQTDQYSKDTVVPELRRIIERVMAEYPEQK